MRLRLRTLLVPVLLIGVAAPARAEIPDNHPNELWPDGAPGAKGTEPLDRPTLAVYRPPSEQANGAGVIVCPGGGYRVVAIDHEGVQVARRLNEMGVTAFVLKYRLKPQYEPSDALLDAQRALRYVRQHSEALGVSPDRLGLLGFSAGGHLASAAGTSFDPGDPDAEDPIDRQGSRPDFLVLGYPVISAELRDEGTYTSTDTQVTSKTPPTFFFHTSEDTGVPAEHSIRFYQALRREGVPAELHIFARGPHGVGLAPGDPSAGAWPDLLHRWLRSEGWLAEAPRVAVSGKVTLDGQPLHRGWITFQPIGPGAESRPVASAYITERTEGGFQSEAARGPCPGEHRVEIRLLASALKDEPSLDGEILLAGPGTSSPLVIEIASDGPNRFDFDSGTP
ncbi:hypothetical protein BH23PLA1_BH23PLA1_06150 [soil metagenome]